MTLKYSVVEFEGFKNLTVVNDGEIYQVSNDNPRFEEMLELAKKYDESVIGLFNPEKGIAESFNKVSERVSIRSGNVYLDHELIDGALTDQIVRFYDAGEDFTPLVKFLENVANNPSADSRAQLYTFARENSITINQDGHLVLYKGLRRVVGDHDAVSYTSISHGKAIVDGVEHDGAIPNYQNAVVEMPRSTVTWNPNVACHVGLHAGAYQYASNFAQGGLMTVIVNPRDVVSVPVDSSYQKVRVCRYVVGDIIEQEITSPYYSTDDEVEDEEWDDEEELDYDEEDDLDEEVESQPKSDLDYVTLYTPATKSVKDDEPEDDGEGEDWDMTGYDDDVDKEQTVGLDESPDAVSDEPEEVESEHSKSDSVKSETEDVSEQSVSSSPAVTDVHSVNGNLRDVTNFNNWGTN